MYLSSFQTDSSKVIHKVIIYVQLHPQVQQMSDIRIVQSCVAPAVDAATTTGAEGAILDPDQQKVQITAPSWMEVVRGGRLDGPKIRGPVKVGETIGILVKANVKGSYHTGSLVMTMYNHAENQPRTQCMRLINVTNVILHKGHSSWPVQTLTVLIIECVW